MLNDRAAKPKRARECGDGSPGGEGGNQRDSRDDLHDDGRSARGVDGLLSLNIAGDLDHTLGTPDGSQRNRPSNTECKKKKELGDGRKAFEIDCTTVYLPNGKAQQKTPLNKAALQKFGVE